MKNNFKLFVLLLCVLLAVTCISISGISQETEKAQKKFKIGYDIYWVGNAWSVMLAEEFKAAVQKPEYKDIVDVVYTESENSINKMINNIEDLIAQKCDAIIITPTSPTALTPVLKKARNAGIKVILNATLIEDEDGYDALVYYDFLQVSRLRMEWLARKLNYKGKVLEIYGISGYAANEDSIRGHKEIADKYKDIEIIGGIDGEWNYAATKIAMANALTVYPEIDGILSADGESTLGAIEAMEEARRPLVPILSDANNGFLKKWFAIRKKQEAGDKFYEKFDAASYAMPSYISVTALKVAVDLLQGNPVEFEKDYRYPKAILEKGVGEIDSTMMEKLVRPDLPDGVCTLTALSDEQLKKLFGK